MKAHLARCCHFVLLAAALAQAADLYRVSGVVVNSETGTPLPRAIVAVQMETGPVISRQVTASDGRFSFALPEGKYRLAAGTPDAMEQYGLRAADVLVASAVITGPGKDTASLVFRWRPVSAIFGKIVDDNGDPVENALVQLIAARVTAGRREITTFGWQRTDDRGEYRFGRIVGGTYYLAVTGTPWYAQRARIGGPDASESMAFAPIYYPNTADPTAAAPLTLRSGEEVRADFTLRAVPGATLTVTYDSPLLPSGTVALVQEGIGGTNGFQREERTRGFRQVLSGVPPGRYLVRVTGTRANGTVSAHQWITLSSTDLEVKLTLRPVPSLSGTLAWKNPAARPPGTVLITALSEDRSNSSVTVSTKPDGSFTFGNLPSGRYRPAVRIGSTYFPVTLHAEGGACTDGVLDLAEDETVTLQMTAFAETGTVKGYAKQAGLPLEGAMVVLAPVQDKGDWLAYRGFQTDSDGSFDFANVPVGDYFLFTVDDVHVEYTNPTVIRPFFFAAKRVHVEQGDRIAQDLDVLPPRDKP